MTIGKAPICLGCKNFNEDDHLKFSCKAFPEGIPMEIVMSGFIHKEPYSGDRGFQYQPKEK